MKTKVNTFCARLFRGLSLGGMGVVTFVTMMGVDADPTVVRWLLAIGLGLSAMWPDGWDNKEKGDGAIG